MGGDKFVFVGSVIATIPLGSGTLTMVRRLPLLLDKFAILLGDLFGCFAGSLGAYSSVLDSL